MSRKILLALSLFIIFCGIGYVMFNTKEDPLKENIETQTTSIEYRNEEYGFVFSLPLTWKGYSIKQDTWKAYSPNKPQGAIPDETGSILSIRNPLWSVTAPRQDIPIMVFTLAQWKLIVEDKIHIGAAPIIPSELGRNAKYVFALPARYNYAFPLGYEEVERIMQTKPLQGF